jgi:hypothetical protein
MDRLSLHFVKFSLQIAKLQGDRLDGTESSATQSVSPMCRNGGLVEGPLHRYNALVRLLIRVHVHRSAIAFMSRAGVPTGHG